MDIPQPRATPRAQVVPSGQGHRFMHPCEWKARDKLVPRGREAGQPLGTGLGEIPCVPWGVNGFQGDLRFL